MADGTVLRCHLAVLPGGGRMLIYSDVTDIVRQAEELERLATGPTTDDTEKPTPWGHRVSSRMSGQGAGR